MDHNDNRYKTLDKLPWDKYPVRVCRSMHHCEVCSAAITIGQQYRDGGYTRRAHVECVSTPNPTPTEGEG